MPKDMPVRRDLPRAHHKTAPYPQLSAPRQEPTTAPKQAQKPTLPPEIQGAILAQNVPWSSKDVRALSQSSHALNAWIRALQPQSYRQAHRMTLAKALTSPRFDMSNRRAQSVLRGLDSLHLLGAPKAVGKRPRLDPCGAHPARLAEVVAAIGPTQAIHLGAETRSMAPWLRLLEAGLQAHALTTLNLAAANLCFNDLEQLGGTFAQLPGLQHLHLPNKVQQGTRRRTQASALSFAPLLSLRTLTWKALIRVPYAEVDLSANRHLRVLKLGLGASASLGFAGWELSAYAPGTTVKLPPAALNVLHLDGLVLSPGTAHHLRDAPWQRTLVELKLNLHPACP